MPLQSSGFWFTIYPLLLPVALVVGFVAGSWWERWRSNRKRNVI